MYQNNSWIGSSTGSYMAPINWTNQYTITTAETSLSLTPFVPAPTKPETAVDWLRSRVRETCDAAFDGIAV